MKLRRLRKNVKAISPIISVLLMIAVAVVAALVTYAWVMGYIGFTTNKTGHAIQIQSIALTGNSPGTVAIYVQNVGSGPIGLQSGQCLYINGQLDSGCTVTVNGVASSTLPENQTAIVTSSIATYIHSQTITVKVTTADGTYSQVTQPLP